MSIGERILKYRKDNNITQEELAKELNVSNRTIAKWENNQSSPDLDTIASLCKILNVTADQLVLGRDSNKNEGNNSNNKVKACVISLSVFLYFLGVIWVILGEEVLILNDGIVVCGFLLICAIATCILIYYFTSREKSVKPKEKKNDSITKNVNSVLGLVFSALYLVISFKTMAWHITWILWLIYAALIKLIELLFELKKDE